MLLRCHAGSKCEEQVPQTRANSRTQPPRWSPNSKSPLPVEQVDLQFGNQILETRNHSNLKPVVSVYRRVGKDGIDNIDRHVLSELFDSRARRVNVHA